MILQLKCDRCGKIGEGDEIVNWQSCEDLCLLCLKDWKIEDLKQQIAEKKEWLEATHLKKLRELQGQLEELERS